MRHETLLIKVGRCVPLLITEYFVFPGDI